MDLNFKIDMKNSSASYSDDLNFITRKIKNTIKLDYMYNVLMIVSIITGPLLIILIPLFFILKMLNRSKPVYLDYNFGDEDKIKYFELSEAWREISKSHLCRLVVRAENLDNNKRNAGASKSLTLQPCFITDVKQFYIKTNVDFVTIGYNKNKTQLLILPDKLYFVGAEIKCINYSDVKIEVNDVQYIEKGFVPKDAQILRHTYKHVNKDGSPDKRFSDNPKYSVCKYAGVALSSSNNVLDINIMISNADSTDKLKSYVGKYGGGV